MMINSGLTGTIMPLYATESLGFSLSHYALLVAFTTVGNITGNLVGGILSDRFGRKKMLLAGFALGLIAVLGLTLFNVLFPLFIMMFFLGAFWGVLYGVAPAYIADSVPTEIRGIGIGIYRTFFDLGGLVGPVAMSSIAEIFGGTRGYLSVFYFSAILLVGLISVTMTLKKREPEAVSKVS